MASLSPVPSMEDLKITFQESCLVFPLLKTPKQSIFLSNIDQMPNYNISTAHFFDPNPEFPPEKVANLLKTALEKVLVPYDFMAGRLKLNHETGRLEIDCNAAGAGFVVASSEFSVDEMRDYLSYPNVGYQQLVIERLDNLAPQVEQPLCIFQITSFKCGGFAFGVMTNHILFDGIGAKTFLQNLASQTFDHKPLSMAPWNNRRLLAARSPPCVEFQHQELLDLKLPTGKGSSPPVFDCGREELDYRIFKFSSTDISKLKEQAKCATDTIARISSFGVVAAFIWRCKASSINIEHSKDKYSTLLNVINLRTRVTPLLPPAYSGNAVLPIGVSATFEELENWPFSKIVMMISKMANQITNEYVKSVIDWLEVNRGLPYGDYMVTSWLRLGFDEVVYAWGNPIYSCPVVNHRKDICWIFSDAIDGGVSAMVALPPKEMERFEGFFRKHFA